VVCTSCGNLGHGSAKLKECINYKKTQEEALKDKLGEKFERYTRKLRLETILREEHKDRFNEKIKNLSSLLREVLIKAQLFVNYCLIDNKELNTHNYLYQQSFWYSICQLIMKQSVTNKKNISNSFVLAFSDFSESYPTIFCPVKERKITGYSDSLFYACMTVATTYSNLITENFEHTVIKYIRHQYKKIMSVRTLRHSYLVLVEKHIINMYFFIS
jgi:hypothetical protein